MTVEHATRSVRVSPELVEFLSNEWSAPVQVKISKDDGETLELIMRTPEPSDPREKSPV